MFRVSCGYDTNGKQIVRQKTWTPDKNMTPKQIEKEVNRQAVLFEEECKNGYQSKVRGIRRGMVRRIRKAKSSQHYI